jgi:peroxiredoxin Q/BCP
MSQTVVFSLPNQDGDTITSDDFPGRRLIVFFYPAAMTPGCTKESCDFRDSYDEFAEAGYEIVGVSPDSPARNAKFKAKEGLNFDLLSDEDKELATSLGVWGEKKLYGKTMQGVIRSTFVIGPDGTVDKAYRNVKATGHVARLKEELLG